MDRLSQIIGVDLSKQKRKAAEQVRKILTTKEAAGETQLALLTLEIEEEGHKPWNAATSSSWE